MKKSIVILLVVAVVVVIASFFTKKMNVMDGGEPPLSVTDMAVRTQEYQKKMKEAQAQKIAQQMAQNEALQSASSADLQAAAAAGDPAPDVNLGEPIKLVAMPTPWPDRSFSSAELEAAVKSGAANPRPVLNVPIGKIGDLLPVAPPRTEALSPQRIFEPGTRSIYLQIGGGAVLWVTLSSAIDETTTGKLTSSLKGVCLAEDAGASGSACDAIVPSEPILVKKLTSCATDVQTARAEMLSASDLQAKIYLGCAKGKECAGEPKPAVRFAKQTPAEAMDAIGEIEALIIPNGGCRRRIQKGAQPAGVFVVEKVLQTVRSTL